MCVCVTFVFLLIARAARSSFPQTRDLWERANVGERVGRVSSDAVSRWSRSPGCCGFRGVFWVGRIFSIFFFFERTRPAASMRTPCLIHLSTSTGVRTGCHYLISLYVSVCNARFYWLRALYEADFHNPGSMLAREYGLTRGTRFVARCLEVVAVAGLVSWCVLGGAGFFRFGFFPYFVFQTDSLLQV